MVDSTGVRLGLISPGEWSDGLQRKGSNPLSTTKILCPDGEMVDTGDSKSPAERCVGSNPTLGTRIVYGWSSG